MDDRILLTGLTFYGYHGANPEERVQGQRFVVDVRLQLDLRPAGQSDDLAQTVNYSQVYRLVRDIVEGPACNLIETVAERIATALLHQTQIRAVGVRVSKPWAPIKGMVAGEVAVEIQRRRDVPHP
ncbi:MAG TPA: dihydroneopterin aldolase [Chloroflexota bacterium]|nr:dihydroneopterin aldolase [Chloroflexota bacterium]